MAVLKRFEVWLLLLVIAGAVWFVFQTPVEEESGDPVTETVVAKVPDSPVEKTDEKKEEIVKTEETPVSEPKTTPGTEANDSKAVEASGDRFEIRDVKSISEKIGSVFEFTVRGRTDKSIEMSSPQVRLVTESGQEIERFFLPFDPTPVLKPGDESEAVLKYWVQGDLNEKLWLEIDGDRVAVELKKQ